MEYYSYRNVLDIMLMKTFKASSTGLRIPLKKFNVFVKKKTRFKIFTNYYLFTILNCLRKEIFTFLNFDDKKSENAYKFLKMIYFLYSLNKNTPKKKHLVTIYPISTKINVINVFKKKLFFLKKINRSGKKLLTQKFHFLKKKFYLYSSIYFKSSYIWWKIGVTWYYHQVSNKLFIIMLTATGSYSLEPLAWGLYHNIFFLPPTYYKIVNFPVPLGFNSLVKYFMYSYYYYNLSFNKKQYAFSPGTFVKFLYFDNKEDIFFVRLPSGSITCINLLGYVYVGRNSNIFVNKIIYGGFFSKYFSPLKQWFKNRGVSMNPVDHPNGGRTKVKNPLLTPWGKIAKKSK